MNRLRITLSLLATAFFFCWAVTGVSAYQSGRFVKDGLVFDYPAEWPLRDESDQNAQHLTLDLGKDEAEIVILAFRRALTSQQMAEAKAAITPMLIQGTTKKLQELGGNVQQTSVSGYIGGVSADGVRLRAVLQGEAGNAEIYWASINNRLVYVIFIGSDQARVRAGGAWSLVCNSLRVSATSAPEPTPNPAQSAPPTDLSNYGYRTITNARVELYMDRWGKGYVHDTNRGAWVRIPESLPVQVQPAYCKASNTMALVYGNRGLVVYDSSLYTPTNPAAAWVSNLSEAFSSFSRSRVTEHAAQLNDFLALAVGTNWLAAYDRTRHSWSNYQAGADDSTATLDQYLVLTPERARVKVLNGPFCTYTLARGSWYCND